MKYEISRKSSTYKKLIELKELAAVCIKEANDLSASLGGTICCRASGKAWGGISGIQFETPPAGWNSVGPKNKNYYFPKARKRAVLKQIEALPTLDFAAANEIVGFEAQTVSTPSGLVRYGGVGLLWRDDKEYILLDIPDGAKFKPSTDIVLIDDSMYNLLANAK